MAGLRLLYILCLCIVTPGLSSPVKNLPAQEEEPVEMEEEISIDKVEDENEVDPRLLQNSSDDGLGPYECSDTSQCANNGQCVDTGKAGKICNCTRGFLGPNCDYSSSSIDKALRIYDLFKVSFAECMTKAGHTAGINAVSLFQKCGGGQNFCWLREGGVKGLKCLFWCLTSSMRLSLTEAKPSEESRLQLYTDVFQKLARERQLPDKKPHPKPKGVPVASLQINLYNIPGPNSTRSNPMGLPQIEIKPSWTYWDPVDTNDSDYPIPKGPYDDPEDPDEEPQYPHPLQNPNFEFPRSDELSELPSPSNNESPSPSDNETGPFDLGEFDPFSFGFGPYDPLPPEVPDKDDKPEESQGETPATPSDNFLNEALHDYMVDIQYDIVGSTVGGGDDDNDDDSDDDSDYDLTPYEMNPVSDPLSNIRTER